MIQKTIRERVLTGKTPKQRLYYALYEKFIRSPELQARFQGKFDAFHEYSPDMLAEQIVIELEKSEKKKTELSGIFSDGEIPQDTIEDFKEGDEVIRYSR